MENLYEVLNDFEQMRKEREALWKEYEKSLACTVHENKYYDFIRHRLFPILKNSILNYSGSSYGDHTFYARFSNNSVEDRDYLSIFCKMYGFDLRQLDQTNFYITGIFRISDIKRLLDAFYGELQKIEHYSKTPKEMQAERDAFLEGQREGR